MKTSQRIFVGVLALMSYQAHAQSSLNNQPGDSRVPPPADTEGKKPLPGDQGFADINSQIQKSQEALKATLGSATVVEPPKPNETAPAGQAAAPTVPPSTPPPADPAPVVQQRPARQPARAQPPAPPPAEVYLPQNGTTVFNKNLNTEWQEETVTLPGLSSAFGTILFGEEVAATEKDWVAARIDYAFLGANGTVMELNGCRIEIEIHPNFNSAKVKGELKKIFCRSKDGKVFSQDLSGKMVSAKSEYGGVESDYIMAGPARGIALQAIQTMTKGVGEAMAAAQITQQASSSQFSTFATTNVTGDKDKYIAGKALAASGDFLQYAVDFYKGLSPTLALPPGTKIHMVVKENVEIPKEFFTRKINVGSLEKDLTS